jgi:chromate reductase
MRASVLGPEFFDAERHPEVTFRSTAVRLAGDGRADIDGELTIRGVTRPVTASGRYAAPRQAGFGEAAGLQLYTSVDRREFGFEWQVELRSGGDAVSWDVEVEIDLLLMRADAEPKGDVLLVSGSLRRGSFNSALLREAATALPIGVGHVWLEEIGALPPYSEDDDGERAPADVERLRRTIAAADPILIATPQYNGSIPEPLKNVVDWASRPFPGNAWRGKPVAVIGASTGIFGAVWAQAELRKVLRSAGARVIGGELAVGAAHDAFLPSGALRDPDFAAGLGDVVAALLDARPGRGPAPAGRRAAPDRG